MLTPSLEDLDFSFNEEFEGVNSPLLQYPYDENDGPSDGLSSQQTQIIQDLINQDAMRTHFQVEYQIFPKTVHKIQRRISVNNKKISQQRLNPHQSKIRLKLIFPRDGIFQEIYRIVVKVQRQNGIMNQTELYTDMAQLDEATTQIYQETPNSNEVILTANLDSVYKVNGKNFYQLEKSNVIESNQFIVVIEAIFHNGTKSFAVTKPFLCVGRSNGIEKDDTVFHLPQILRPENKKRRHNLGIPTSSNSPNNSDSDSTSYSNPRLNEQYSKVQKMVCDFIRAKEGKFDTIEGKVIKTGNGDIAYHFIIKNPHEHDEFYPGEVIGFFTDHLGKTVIQKLTSQNVSDAFLKGVVSECQFLEANKPDDEAIKTATICMLGLVPVRVIGSIKGGESLFASTGCPGIAISEHHSSYCPQETTALIGQAMEKKKCYNEDEVHHVKALVSLVGSSNLQVIQNQCMEIEKGLNFQLEKGGKRSKRCQIISTILICLIVAILAVLFWQLFVPGSHLRVSQCKVGSIKGSTLKFWKWQDGKRYHGVEFGCVNLWNKVKDHFYIHKHEDRHNFTYRCPEDHFHYYLNVDACSGISTYSLMFAVDPNCTHVFSFKQEQGIWKQERLVCWYPKCNIKCSFIKPKRSRQACKDKYFQHTCKPY